MSQIAPQAASTTTTKRPNTAPVIPAQAGIHVLRWGGIDSRLRGNDKAEGGNDDVRACLSKQALANVGWVTCHPRGNHPANPAPRGLRLGSLTHPTQLRQATTEEHSVVQPASTTAAKRPSPAPVIPAQAGIHALRVGCIASRLRGSDKTGQGNRMFGINI